MKSDLLPFDPRISDFQLADALRKRGWEGDFKCNYDTATTTFTGPSGKVIGKVVYDNKECCKKYVYLTQL